MNHLMLTLPSKVYSRTLSHFFFQTKLSAISAQKPSGSLMDRWYISWYTSNEGQLALPAKFAGGGMSFPPVSVVVTAAIFSYSLDSV